MTLIFNKKASTKILLPRDKQRFLQFLTIKGFNPRVGSLAPYGEVVFIAKEYSHYRMNGAWDRFTGYDKILKKLLTNYKKSIY